MGTNWFQLSAGIGRRASGEKQHHVSWFEAARMICRTGSKRISCGVGKAVRRRIGKGVLAYRCCSLYPAREMREKKAMKKGWSPIGRQSGTGALCEFQLLFYKGIWRSQREYKWIIRQNHCPANGHLRLNEVLDIKGYCGKWSYGLELNIQLQSV